jgi:hypothetical protein
VSAALSGSVAVGAVPPPSLLVLFWADSEIRSVALAPQRQPAGMVMQWSAASVVRQVAFCAPGVPVGTDGRPAMEPGFMSGLELRGQWAPGHEPGALPALFGRIRAGRLQCAGVWLSQLPVPWRSPCALLLAVARCSPGSGRGRGAGIFALAGVLMMMLLLTEATALKEVPWLRDQSVAQTLPGAWANLPGQA